MNQRFSETQKHNPTCRELLITGTTMGEHSRRLRAERNSRVLATSILIFILVVIFFTLGVLPAVAG